MWFLMPGGREWSRGGGYDMDRSGASPGVEEAVQLLCYRFRVCALWLRFVSEYSQVMKETNLELAGP